MKLEIKGNSNYTATVDIEVFKNKSPLFLEKETKNLDKGEENIEDNQEETI